MVIAAVIYLTICLALSMLPTIIAWRRGHESLVAILLLNLLLGWTGIGWVVALVWSVGRASSGEKQVIVNNHVIVQGHQSVMHAGLPYPEEEVVMPAMPMLTPPQRAYAPAMVSPTVIAPKAFGRRNG